MQQQSTDRAATEHWLSCGDNNALMQKAAAAVGVAVAVAGASYDVELRQQLQLPLSYSPTIASSGGTGAEGGAAVNGGLKGRKPSTFKQSLDERTIVFWSRGRRLPSWLQQVLHSYKPLGLAGTFRIPTQNPCQFFPTNLIIVR